MWLSCRKYNSLDHIITKLFIFLPTLNKKQKYDNKKFSTKAINSNKLEVEEGRYFKIKFIYLFLLYSHSCKICFWALLLALPVGVGTGGKCLYEKCVQREILYDAHLVWWKTNHWRIFVSLSLFILAFSQFLKHVQLHIQTR